MALQLRDLSGTLRIEPRRKCHETSRHLPRKAKNAPLIRWRVQAQKLSRGQALRACTRILISCPRDLSRLTLEPE